MMLVVLIMLVMAVLVLVLVLVLLLAAGCWWLVLHVVSTGWSCFPGRL
jgi:hypothetical protein